jgi:MerR family transcriptional regulator/heat shock protein HspR
VSSTRTPGSGTPRPEVATATAPRGGTAHGVYAISVAAELTGTAVQNLRVYERHGLVRPSRTDGGTRRYSEDDLDRIRRVLSLLAAGLNLAGIALVLRLEEDNARLRRRHGDEPGPGPAERQGADR